VEAAVREFLTGELGKDTSAVGAGDSLLESGVIDSLAVVQLVAFIERTYGVKIEEDDLLPENFDSLSAIAAFVAQLRAGTRD